MGCGTTVEPGLVNQAANLAGPVEQMAEPRDDVFVVARVSVQDRGRIGDDVVQGQGQLTIDRLDRCALPCWLSRPEAARAC